MRSRSAAQCWRLKQPLAAGPAFAQERPCCPPAAGPGRKACPVLRGSTVNIASWWSHGCATLDATASRNLDLLAVQEMR
eukprot:6558724-Alexandrium_andersonii.AAC.1